MKCIDMQELLALYADESLEQQKTAVAMEHLAHCSYCRAELAQIKKVLTLVREADPPAPPNLHHHIMEGVRKEQKGRRNKLSQSWWKLSRPLAAVAAVLLIFFGSGNLYLTHRYLNSPPGFGMLASEEMGNDMAVEDRVKTDAEVDVFTEELGSPEVSPPRDIKGFLFFNAGLLVAGGGAWYYVRRKHNSP